MQLLKEKLEKSRSEAVSDFEQMMAELNRRNEREKQILLEDNKKLSSNIDFVSFIIYDFLFLPFFYPQLPPINVFFFNLLNLTNFLIL